MKILSRIFGSKEQPLKSYNDFWNWFQKNQLYFYKVVKNNEDIEKDFFDKLSPKLGELREGFLYLTGMYNDNTVELIFTADGGTKNIVFVEELVNAAPVMNGWKITSLKPELDIANVNIEMNGYKFSNDNIKFYSEDNFNYPDEIEITFVHNDLDEYNKEDILNGIYVLLDNYLGELNFATVVDSIDVVPANDAKKDLISLTKLKEYLNWRQEEFIEKYEGLRYDTKNDNHHILKSESESGENFVIAVINTDLLLWDCKASHPWLVKVEMNYVSEKNIEIPDSSMYKLLEKIEDDLLADLKDFEGNLNIGRQTGNGTREIYFACRDFRKPSKVLDKIVKKYSNEIGISCSIFKDKYWRTFRRFEH
jgi:uncharacterized protein DUF695